MTAMENRSARFGPDRWLSMLFLVAFVLLFLLFGREPETSLPLPTPFPSPWSNPFCEATAC